MQRQIKWVDRIYWIQHIHAEQGKVDEGQDEIIALTSDDTESNDETQVNEMSSASPSDVDANETATAVEDSDEREDHSSSGIEMVSELMNQEDAVVDADSSERDVDDTMRETANEMGKEIEMEQDEEMDGRKDDVDVELDDMISDDEEAELNVNFEIQ
eukprot:228915_1